MIYETITESLYPTELESLEIRKLANKSYAIGSAVCCAFAQLETLKKESMALNLQKWHYSFVVLLVVGLLIDTYFQNFHLPYSLGVWISAFAVLQLLIITIKASKYASKIERVNEKLESLDLEWAKIHGRELNTSTFLLGELRGAVKNEMFYPASDVFMDWRDKEYDRIFAMVAGADKLAEKNKPCISRLPG